jgi:Ser/Thr protein kinase RdoA (MazF antagonist)
VRTLPQAPNLDYLKQQAKDLLAALRESEPCASHSDAQRTLAEQYGFRTWSELKAEVERVRSKPAEFAEVALGIAKTFAIGELTHPATVVAHEVMGPSIRLRTEGGTWSAHAVLFWVDEEQAEETVRLMEAAGAAGIKTPKAVRSISGALVEQIGDHRWRVDEWMELGPSIASPVSTATAHKAGELLGTLHSLNLRPARGMNPWLGAKRRTAEEWQEILEIVEKADMPWARTLHAALPAILEMNSVAVDPPTDNLVLSHTNLQPSTVRVGKDDSLVPGGWEFAGAIPKTWDIGMVLGSWCGSPNERITEVAARPILEGYASITGTRPTLDISILSPAITAWLNWLVSRIGYALEGDGDTRERATMELLNMLKLPKTRASFERLLRAACAT